MSSGEAPFASSSSTISTLILVPRMQGFPPRTVGVEVIQSATMVQPYHAGHPGRFSGVKLAHHYRDIEVEKVWKYAAENIPELIEMLELPGSEG
jgi:hypothetical protein